MWSTVTIILFECYITRVVSLNLLFFPLVLLFLCVFRVFVVRFQLSNVKDTFDIRCHPYFLKCMNVSLFLEHSSLTPKITSYQRTPLPPSLIMPTFPDSLQKQEVYRKILSKRTSFHFSFTYSWYFSYNILLCTETIAWRYSFWQSLFITLPMKVYGLSCFTPSVLVFFIYKGISSNPPSNMYLFSWQLILRQQQQQQCHQQWQP